MQLQPPVPASGGDTGFNVVLVEAEGERTFITSPGCEGDLPQAELDRISLAPGDTVYASGYDLAYPNPALGPWLANLPADVLLPWRLPSPSSAQGPPRARPWPNWRRPSPRSPLRPRRSDASWRPIHERGQTPERTFVPVVLRRMDDNEGP